MLSQELIYSKERNSWNLFVNGEWYFEGDYEQCADMMLNNAVDDAEDYYPEDDYPDELDDDYSELDLANEAMFAETMD